MKSRRTADFLGGLASGALAALVVGLVALFGPQLMDHSLASNLDADAALTWLHDNLGMSVLPFSATLLMFTYSLRHLEKQLASGSPAHKVAQADQLTDIWIGLFFGIGVLWTAIGMRSALLYALGDGVDAVADGGAAGLLDRLVRGGILTALTTTIVGGAGGYLLRLYKTVRMGDRLKHFYSDLDQHRSQRVETLLGEIRDRIPGDHPGGEAWAEPGQAETGRAEPCR